MSHRSVCEHNVAGGVQRGYFVHVCRYFNLLGRLIVRIRMSSVRSKGRVREDVALLDGGKGQLL